MEEMMSIREAFGDMEDPRHPRNLRYPLLDVMALAIYGVLCGKTDFASMADYLKLREAELTEALGLTAGVPSHDVFSDVFRRMDVHKFLECFTRWLSSALSALSGEHIAIDGKALIAATEKSGNGKIPYILNAYVCGLGITVCQLEIGEKSNEITDIPKLLDMMDISECVVTIDAIGTQVRIMDLIVGKCGHFCLQLKKNQKTAFMSVNQHFCGKIDQLEDGAEPHEVGLDVHEESDRGHGRVEHRTYMTTVLSGDDLRILPKSWKHVRCVGMAVLEREVVGDSPRRSTEVHYHVMDVAMAAEEYAGYARGHWAEENSLHHVLDVYLREDACTARADNAKSNLALLRKICLNLIRQVKEKGMSTNMVLNRFQVQPETFRRFLFESVPMRLAEREGDKG